MLNVLLLVLALGWTVPDVGPVVFDPETPYRGAYGLTCAPAFREIPGNAQGRCPEGYEGIVVYLLAFSNEQTLRNVVAHEQYHLDHQTIGPADDPFREREAYAAACKAFPIPKCEEWLR